MPHPGPISYGGSYEQFSFPTVTREDERKQFDATPTLLQVGSTILQRQNKFIVLFRFNEPRLIDIKVE
jgi:hypothetical protein